MLQVHILRRLGAMSLILALGSACGDQEKTPTSSSCPQGQQRNPITGLCQSTTPDDKTPDMSVTRADMNAKDQDVTSPLDLGPRDMGRMDMSSPPKDMGGQNPKDDMGMPPMELQRFIAIGDTGTGSAMQLKVGQSIGLACAARGGCDFGMLLGDNAYDSGFESENDPRFVDFFSRPYGHLGFPFYIVLGNHDLGGDGLGVDLDQRKGDYQVKYGLRDPQWLMPAKHYQVRRGPLWLMGLNTTDVFFNRAQAQGQELDRWIAQAPPQTWKVAFGHHPYISNGKHGNAGEYDGVSFIPIANGEHVESFVKDHICGKVDVYLCGHDHNMQDLVAKCGTEFIVSGAGAKTTDLKGVNPVHYESDEPGFFMLEATTNTITVLAYDQDGVLKHTRQITR